MADDIVSPVRYRAIFGIIGYRVGSDGSFWTCWERKGGKGRGNHALGKTWRRLKGNTNRLGYVRVSISVNGEEFRYNLHQLVCEAFNGVCPEGMECCHYDGNPSNNRIENLRWDTPANNHADKKRHGTWSVNVGSKHGNSKLNDDIVLEILRRHAAGEQQKTIGESLNLHQSTINGIVRGKRWKHVQRPEVNP